MRVRVVLSVQAVTGVGAPQPEAACWWEALGQPNMSLPQQLEPPTTWQLIQEAGRGCPFSDLALAGT